jgi:hypothetical protein
MHIGFWKQNVGEEEHVLHMGFEAKHGISKEHHNLNLKNKIMSF